MKEFSEWLACVLSVAAAIMSSSAGEVLGWFGVAFYTAACLASGGPVKVEPPESSDRPHTTPQP